MSSLFYTVEIIIFLSLASLAPAAFPSPPPPPTPRFSLADSVPFCVENKGAVDSLARWHEFAGDYAVRSWTTNSDRATKPSRGRNRAGIPLSLLSRQAEFSLCSLLCRTLRATPALTELLQLGRSLANCSQFLGLIPHCFRLCLRLSLKRFIIRLSLMRFRSVHHTGSSLGVWTKAYGQGDWSNEVGS